MDADKIREIRIIRENPRFRRYPEYKDSSMKWIGEIPEHWMVERAKFIFRRIQRPVRENDEIITAFRDGIVTLRKNRRTLGFTNSLKEIGYQGLRKGDLVIHAMDGHAGAIGVSDSDGKSSPVYSVCRPISQENVYYYAYLLRYMALSGFIESLARGVRERSTEFRFNEFKELELPIPTVSEQTQIANFLDRKTDQIDKLIRIKERRMELLQEQRTALINQAVTKGLDPNVEMRPSGVEWIGEIPAHWNLSMLKYAARLVYGDTLTSENREDEGVVPVYGSNGIIDTHSSANTLSPAIIVGRKGSLGKIQYSDVPCFVIDTAYYIDRRTSHANLRWLYYVLQALKLEKFRNSVLPGLNREVAEGQYIPLITVEEQAQIAACLDHKTQQIDELIATEQRKIELLKEYRQSLISEAVTGKIDVRNGV